MLSKTRFNTLDRILVLVVSALILVGIIMIATAKQVLIVDSETNKLFINFEAKDLSVVKMQFVWIIISIAVLIGTLFFDYRIIKEYITHIYSLNLILLIIVLIPGIGQVRGGARRWIGIGAAVFQPSELAKILLIIVAAYLLEKHKEELNDFKTLFKIAFMLFSPISLIFIQPHLSGSIIIFSILITLFFIAGVKLKYFGYAGLTGIMLAYPVFQFILKPYQQKRILALLNPEGYKLNQAFQADQSLMAIGSGMQFGKGIGATGINLPEGHTDFIFGMIGAQLGFVGSLLVIILFLILLYRCIIIAINAKEFFDAYLVTGIAAMWGFQAFFNIGVTIRLLPNTGVPLPFISYGGSSLLIQMLCVGLVLNVGMRIQKTMF